MPVRHDAVDQGAARCFTDHAQHVGFVGGRNADVAGNELGGVFQRGKRLGGQRTWRGLSGVTDPARGWQGTRRQVNEGKEGGAAHRRSGHAWAEHGSVPAVRMLSRARAA